MNRAHIATEFGRIVGAYWAPDSAGMGAADRADAYLGTDGTARVFAWRTVKTFMPADRRFDVRVEHDPMSSDAADIERGKTLDPSIRAALQSAIDAAVRQQRDRAAAHDRREDGDRDNYGNLPE